MKGAKTKSSQFNSKQSDIWFDELIGSIRSHELQLNANIANEDTKKLYSNLMNGNLDDLAIHSRDLASRELISRMVYEYVEELNRQKINATNLALQLSRSKVLVWAIIKADDEATENSLLLSEAKINAKYYSIGINISTTIVEDTDNLSIPPHYMSLRKVEN